MIRKLSERLRLLAGKCKNKHAWVYVCLAYCFFILSSCNRVPNEYIDPQLGSEQSSGAFLTDSEMETEIRQSFTQEELQEDYDQLWAILYESFPFLSLTGKSGEELEALHSEKRSLIGTRVTDLEGLFFLMQDTCGALGNIAHLRAVGPEEYAPFYESRLQKRDQMDAPKDTAIFLDPQTVESYTQLGFLECKPADSYYANPLSMEYLPDIHAAYIRLPSFYSSELLEQGVPLAQFLEFHPDVNHVIFDITGNAGGYTNIWMNHLVSAFPETVQWECTSYIRVTDPIAWMYEGYDGYEEITIEPIDPKEKGMPEWVSELQMTHKGIYRLTFPLQDFAGEKVSRQVRRWLLVDGNDASAADVFARFCKDTGWATVVGSRTKGDGFHYAYAPSMVRLNHTGLLFCFFPESAANEDGTLNIQQGTAPDFVKKAKETAREACVRLIKAIK